MPTTWLLQMGSQGKEVRVSISKVKNNVNVSGEGQRRAFFRMVLSVFLLGLIFSPKRR